MQKTYILKPTMTFKTLPNAPASHKPSERTVDVIVTTIMPVKSRAVRANKPRFVPAPQPLPCAKLVADRPALKLGLDVHLCSALFAIPLLLSSRFSPDATYRPLVIRSRKRENSRHTISPDISSKVVKCDGIGCLRHATAIVSASTITAGRNRHEP